ncbi:MAG: hypothetical protein Q8O55_00690 [Dehalococcoidales bacterium]|nr:hypothetical protein [Dehalococcoidales bacterium]
MTVATLRPNAAGDLLGLSQYPASGANWDKVAEAVEDSGATYVWTDQSVAWQRDLYNLPSLPSGILFIAYIKVIFWAERLSGTSGSGRTIVKTGGTEYDGGQNNLTTAWAEYSTIHTTNPQTGVAWTVAEVNALQVGVRLKGDGTSGQSACTQIYVEVVPSHESSHHQLGAYKRQP